MEWLAIAVVLAGGGVLAWWRFVRERHHDALIQWVVKGAFPVGGGVKISVKPIGGEVRDVRIVIGLLGGLVEHPELARAEWPTGEKQTLSMTLHQPGIEDWAGSLFVTLIYRPDASPALRFEEWVPVLSEGPAADLALRQDARGPLARGWARLRSASVEPTRKGQRRRRVTQRIEGREVRRRMPNQSQAGR